MGNTFTGTLPAGGVCTCLCGSTVANADYDYAAQTGTPKAHTKSVVASAAACTIASCRTAYAGACGTASSVTANYQTVTAAMAASVPKSKVTGVGSICATVASTCTAVAATNPCPPYLTTGVYTSYVGIGSVTNGLGAVTTCNMAAAGLSAGQVATAICTTNNCNAPPSPSAAVAAKTAVATLAAAALAVAAL